jgi:hypothetical protein
MGAVSAGCTNTEDEERRVDPNITAPGGKWAGVG